MKKLGPREEEIQQFNFILHIVMFTISTHDIIFTQCNVKKTCIVVYSCTALKINFCGQPFR